MKSTKQKLIFIAVIIIVLILGVIFIYTSQKKNAAVTLPLTILGTTPQEGSSQVSPFDSVTITFNQRVNPQEISVTSTPSENWSVSQNISNILTITHGEYLRVATPYTLTIMQDNKTIGTLKFETAHEQNDPRLLQTLQSELDQKYPLASLTPYETSDYKVVYSAPLTFEIQIKSSIQPQDAISQVKEWVKSNGVDPATHKYIISP